MWSSRTTAGVYFNVFISVVMLVEVWGLDEWVDKYVAIEEQRLCSWYPCEIRDSVQGYLDQLLNQTTSHEPEDETDMMKAEGVVNGDMKLCPHQLQQLLKKAQSAKPTRVKRKFNIPTAYTRPWRMPIHYDFDPQLTEEQKGKIEDAISHWQGQTCVKFQNAESPEFTNQNILYFAKSPSVCSSFVGKTWWFPQPIILNDFCMLTPGPIIHELGHALGFWHEQQRPDRDQYVSILDYNIYPGAPYKQLTLIGNTTTREPYDFGSIMQYPAWAFSKTSRDLSIVVTIKPHNWLYVKTMGQTNGLSFHDAKTINREYCSNECKDIQLSAPCQHGGYQDPLRCHQCRCPEGLGGPSCSQLQSSYPNGCGVEVALSEEKPEVTIASPGHPGQSYEDRMHCSWMITAPVGRRLVFRFDFSTFFNLYCVFPVCRHFVEIRYVSDLSITGPRYCCDRKRQIDGFEGSEIVSEGNQILVLFRSNFTSPSPAERVGFSASVSLVEVDGGQEATTTAETITEDGIDTKYIDPIVADVAFILDSSASIGEKNWLTMKAFVKRLTKSFSNSQMRFGMVTFGTQGWLEFDFNHGNTSHVVAAVDQLEWRNEWSNTADGLRMMRQLFTPEHGDRRNAPNVCVLLMDGASNMEENQTTVEAIKARSSGVHIITLGITNKVDELELVAIASSGNSVFSVNSFTDLLAAANAIEHRIRSFVAVSATSTSSTTATPDVILWQCDFEDPSERFCYLEQSQIDDFDWALSTGKTPSGQTGPDIAFSGLYYLYIEASYPRVPNDAAIIYLPPVTKSADYCLKFFYSMYGYHIKTLAVVRKNDPSVYLWSLTGQQSPKPHWFRGSINIYMSTTEQIGFKGIRGDEFSGDIAVDMLELYLGKCS